MRKVLNRKLPGTRNFTDISRLIRFQRLVHTTATSGKKIPVGRVYPSTTYFVRLLRG